MAECIFCFQLFLKDEKFTTLTQKGLDGIIKANESHEEKVFPNIGDKFHERCRKKFLKETSNPRALQPAADDLTQNEFSIKEHCLFCGKRVHHGKPTSPKNVHHVKTQNFRATILGIIAERNDKWAKDVGLRIEEYVDLAVAGATYHQRCNVNFRTLRNMPNAEDTKLGAPFHPQLHDAFLQLVEFLEISDEPYSTDKFQQFSGGEKYCVRYLKDKLVKHFGDRVIFLTRTGLSDVVVMREVSERIIIKAYEQKSKPSQGIMETSADLVLSDIKSIKSNKDSYALPSEIASVEYGLSFIPESLLTFLTRLFGQCKTDQTTRIISIGHAIIQICRPRCVLSPIQLGLGVQISVLTGSRFLVDTLHSLGFCCSYAEVRKFRYCATVSNNRIENEPLALRHSVTKYVADNVDHNLCTLDGKGTFHGMGMIAIESLSGSCVEKKIVRFNATIEDVKKVGSVDIIQYSDDVEDKFFINYTKLTPSTVYDSFSKLDLLWRLSWPTVPERPAWFGFMQKVTTGSFETKPTITYLPMIDLSSSSYTCIYSTLMFIAKEALRNGTLAICTFDQPLWWKARLIIEAEPETSPVKRIVLLLGGFHMKMSYLGCIGYFMTGSGLQEILEQIYAPNSVVRMLNGKAIARAIRAHLLLYAALTAIISEGTYNESEKSVISSIFEAVLSNQQDVYALENNSCLIEMEAKFNEAKKKLKSQCSTSSLWIQYIEMVDILKSNIRGDRIGDYQLHLQTVQEMHPYFAASGHNNYSKGIQIYLQDMQSLNKSNPEVHKFLSDGNFVTRRSNRYWGGLPDDLIIEQVLMRSLKSSGGLTRGTGFGEIQRTVWLHSMPSCAAVNDAMQAFSHKALETSEQHKELGLSRKKRDIEDTNIIYKFLSDKNVFANVTGLRNIVDGVVSYPNCNPHDAKNVGLAIIKKMEGNTSSAFVFKKKDQVVVMNTKNTVQIDNENVQIDPEVLFQRLLFVQNNRNKDDLECVLNYELTQRPPVFFDENGFLRDGNDAALPDLLWKKFGSIISTEFEMLDECCFVLSGEWLINEVVWQRGEAVNDICKRYVEFTLRKFGKAHVIFNESETSPSIMDEKIRRNKRGICGPEISITATTPINTKKQEFLSNPKNRHEFFKMLSEKLKEADCTVFITTDDVNVFIAKKAVHMSATKMTVVVGEETSLLVLMCFYAKNENCGLYLKSCKKVKSTKSTRMWNITETQALVTSHKSKLLLFVNAFGGCQSTSHIFGIGEAAIYNKLGDKHFVAQAEIFCKESASKREIIDAGEQAMVCLFKGKAGQKLNALRYQKYNEKIVTETSNVLAKRLPPTEAATSCHSLRTYYQIHTWMERNKKLNPLEYGWQSTNNHFSAVLTDLPPAPPELLSAIRCGCKGFCDTRRCNCREVGLHCTTACKHCDNMTCRNYDILGEGEDDDEDDFDQFLFDF